jgi:chemotaxis protein methyltransferase CheR
LLTDDQSFSLLKRRILQDRGLDCKQYKENYLKRRIAVRVRATGARDYLDYMRILRNDPEEYVKLLNELTINVTQFFRDPDVYRKLRDHVIPDLLDAKRSLGSKSLRIWSAGCASGEEVYSMAMLVEHRLGIRGEKDRWNIKVVGSDYDPGSLVVAKKGVYQGVEMLDDMRAEEFFDVERKEDTQVFRVNDVLRRRVRFEKINLLEEQAKTHFDMVLCRNVLIYFDRSVQKRLIASLSSSLAKDGYLVLGKSETLGIEAGQSMTSAFPRERIYRLAGGASDRPGSR